MGCNEALNTYFQKLRGRFSLLLVSQLSGPYRLAIILNNLKFLKNVFFCFLELIGTPSAPALVADSLTATSLSLTWEPRNLGNVSYLVQWRYEELLGTWQYYSNTSHSDRSIIHVEKLRPYTKYRVSFYCRVVMSYK